MKNILFVVFVLVITSCVSQKIAKTPIVKLIPQSDSIKRNETCELRMQFTGTKYGHFEFDVFLKNLSNEAISVNPSSFNYVSLNETDYSDSVLVYSINPEEKIEQLEAQRDSLLNEKNPYSLEGKEVMEIVSEGLISGTVALVFGLDPDDLELQRQEDDYDWNYNHNLQWKAVNYELDFWRNHALLPYTLLPNTEINGRVLFPIVMNVEKMDFKVILQNDIYSFKFVQSRY